MNDSDEELVAAVAAGDREAFAALYRRRRADVYRFALHMTGTPSAAEDVAQDVFMVVMHDARRYSPARAAVVPWLLGIARNMARRRLGDRRHASLDETTQDPAVHADPSDRLGLSPRGEGSRRGALPPPG